MTLGNKDRSASNKGFSKSQEEFMNLITKFDPEDLGDAKIQTVIYNYTFMAGVILTSVLKSLSTNFTNLRVGFKTDYEKIPSPITFRP